jgi:hypothetical protein
MNPFEVSLSVSFENFDNNDDFLSIDEKEIKYEFINIEDKEVRFLTTKEKSFSVSFDFYKNEIKEDGVKNKIMKRLFEIYERRQNIKREIEEIKNKNNIF